MRLSTVFLLSIYSLTALAAAMLAYGDETLFPSGITVLVCVVAFEFTERTGWLRLGPLPTNILGLAALGWALYEFFGDRADARLMAGEHFVVYLTWIVLLQEKRSRQYWWLIALGLLQVAIGSVMTLSGWYGFLLVVYLLLALWTLAVFHLLQGAVGFGVEGLGGNAPTRGAEAAVHANRASPDGAALARNGVDALLNARTIVEDAVCQDVPDRWITPRFILGVGGISLSGLAFGFVIFLLVPRDLFGTAGRYSDHDVPLGGVARTGVADTVRLGHMGPILESSDTVFELRLFVDNTKTPVPLDDFLAKQGLAEPLFRGYVLDYYEKGRWSSPLVAVRVANMRRSPRDTGTVRMVRQEYRLAPQSRNILFYIRPATGRVDSGRILPQDHITWNLASEVLSPGIETREQIDYVIYTRETPRSRPRDRGGFGSFVPPAGFDRRAFGPWSDYLVLPEEISETLETLAARWTSPEPTAGEQGTSKERRLARTIESRLRNSGEFSYSLNTAVQDPSLDPVVDFLINTKRGHCEYFASALALLLRAANVPSRIVTGFKGAEYVESKDCYEVQNRHAHAWVEAHVDGEWIPLDATPEAREESVRSFAPNSVFWKSATTSLSALWSTYVISMSYNRQKESLYEPLTGTFAEGWSSVTQHLEAIRGAATWFQDQLRSPESLADGPLPLIALGLAVGFAVCVGLARREWRFAPKGPNGGPAFGWRRRLRLAWLRWWSRASSPRIVTEFYDRFLALAADRGLRPEPNETQYEFSRHVEDSLARELTDGLATLPRDVTGLYCRVRFGGSTPPAAEIVELDDRLRRLGVALRGPRKARQSR